MVVVSPLVTVNESRGKQGGHTEKCILLMASRGHLDSFAPQSKPLSSLHPSRLAVVSSLVFCSGLHISVSLYLHICLSIFYEIGLNDSPRNPLELKSHFVLKTSNGLPSLPWLRLQWPMGPSTCLPMWLPPHFITPSLPLCFRHTDLFVGLPTHWARSHLRVFALAVRFA